MAAADRLWIMVDVETSGPSYARHALLEIGAAVGSRSAGVLDRFSVLVRPTSSEGTCSRRTYDDAVTRGLEARDAMLGFASFARPHLERRASFIARPAAFDWPWIVHYAWTHLGENPFGFKAVCASSWLEARGRRFQVALPHVAVEDAVIQLEHFLAHG